MNVAHSSFVHAAGIGFALLLLPRVAAAEATPAPKPSDEMAEAGYIPGYRRSQTMGLSPYSPSIGTFAGGMTPAFGAPTPREDWTFTWSGYMSATLQASIHER